MILAGDIGGTNTRLGVFRQKGTCKAVVEQQYSSRAASGLEELIERFFKDYSIEHTTIGSACLAIAGPVLEGRCNTTNLPWVVDAKLLSKRLQLSKVMLLNDLEAHAYGLRKLSPKKLHVLQPGLKQVGNQALIFSGTGLGEAGVVWNGKQFYPTAGEGGHVDFAPRNDLEIELLLYLKNKYGHVSYERILSGPGLYEIYQFLIDSKRAQETGHVKRDMQTKNPSFVITEKGRENKDDACVKTLHLFLSLYGAEAGNLALKFLALGGVYIGGGVLSSLTDMMVKSDFLSSFCEKGRFKTLLQSIPVSIVLANNSALLGAARMARAMK